MEDAQQLTISSGLKNVPEIIHSMLYIYVLSQSPVCPCISLFCPSLSMIIKFCEDLLHSSVIKNGIPRPSSWGLMFCIPLLQSEQLAVWNEQYFPLYLYQRVWLWPWFMLASRGFIRILYSCCLGWRLQLWLRQHSGCYWLWNSASSTAQRPCRKQRGFACLALTVSPRLLK